MKQLVIISGKGGTGKTSLTAAFASIAGNAVLADCDVDAANLHLIARPDIKERFEFVGGKKARINPEKCMGCGKCKKLCQFEAIALNGPANDLVQKTYNVDDLSCEGCGVCARFCPTDAIEMADAVNGEWFISETRFGPLIHARLGIAEENSGKLVSTIRKRASQTAQELNKDIVIIDGPPGTGCPVIASITGADMVLVVTEPTMSGKADLDRILALTEHFGIPTSVCINKYDLNEQITDDIQQSTVEMGLAVFGKVEYNNNITKAQTAGQTIIEYGDKKLTGQIMEVWNNVKLRLGV